MDPSRRRASSLRDSATFLTTQEPSQHHCASTKGKKGGILGSGRAAAGRKRGWPASLISEIFHLPAASKRQSKSRQKEEKKSIGVLSAVGKASGSARQQPQTNKWIEKRNFYPLEQIDGQRSIARAENVRSKCRLGLACDGDVDKQATAFSFFRWKKKRKNEETKRLLCVPLRRLASFTKRPQAIKETDSTPEVPMAKQKNKRTFSYQSKPLGSLPRRRPPGKAPDMVLARLELLPASRAVLELRAVAALFPGASDVRRGAVMHFQAPGIS